MAEHADRRRRPAPWRPHHRGVDFGCANRVATRPMRCPTITARARPDVPMGLSRFHRPFSLVRDPGGGLLEPVRRTPVPCAYHGATVVVEVIGIITPTANQSILTRWCPGPGSFNTRHPLSTGRAISVNIVGDCGRRLPLHRARLTPLRQRLLEGLDETRSISARHMTARTEIRSFSPPASRTPGQRASAARSHGPTRLSSPHT